jgi:hypothetical protein
MLSRRAPRPRACALAALVAWFGATGCSRLTLPSGDELASLNRAYDEPKGKLSEEVMEEVASRALDRLDSILGLGRLDFVVDSLTEVSEVVREVTTEGSVRRIRVTALTSVEKICPGEGGEPDSDANGILSYTLRVRENGVLDTVWGDFMACRFPDPGETFPGFTGLPREAGALVTYDGSMDVYLGGNLDLPELDLQRFLFRLEGMLEIGGETVEAALDFRVARDGRTEVRVPADDGDVVFTFTRGETKAGLEAGDGSYCCDFAERSCVRAQSNDCEELMVGDEVIRW